MGKTFFIGSVGILFFVSACGPMIVLESGSDTNDAEDSGDTSPATTGPPTTTVTTSPPPPPSTDTTDGPVLDTGEFDTGEPWSDFPEYCSILEQDCPPGYKCMPYSNDGGGTWNDVMCVPIAEDPNAPGEPCTVQGNGVSGLDDCDITSMCWDVDPTTNEGTCVAHCIGDWENPTCAEPCDQCSISGDGTIVLCLLNCDPILQNCDPGQACYPISDNFICAPDASPPDTSIGSPCEFINVCPPGLICLGASALPECEGSGCCAPMCPVGGADPCPGLVPGTECMPWYEDGPPQPERCLVAEPGACAVPA